MTLNFTAGLMNRDPEVAIFDGPPAEAIAQKFGILDPLRDYVRTQVDKTGTSQRAVATYFCGHDLIGAVYWGGFTDPKDNGIICCVAHCQKPEDFPIAFLKLSEFFSYAIHQHPSPYVSN
jgi:hypothetical protein